MSTKIHSLDEPDANNWFWALGTLRYLCQCLDNGVKMGYGSHVLWNIPHAAAVNVTTGRCTGAAEGDLCDSCEPWPLDSFLPRRGCCARTSSFRSRGSHASDLLAKSRKRRRKVIRSRYSGLSLGFVVEYRSRELCESFETTFIL